ncbi:MAG: alpha/beta hydrolase [Pirellulales bacterium]
MSFVRFALTLVLGVGPSIAWAEEPSISAASLDPKGWFVHRVKSPYQRGETELRVLLPARPAAGERFPVVYVLPVEAHSEHRYGDGLTEITRHDLHNKHRAIVAAASFSHLPWYADHPTDPTIRQESYFVQVVVPFVEKNYPTIASAEGRLLLGFSKSGWGAWSLLLRHPELFGRAAAWDAPLMLEKPGRYGSGQVFGTAENFANYRLSTALRARAESFKKSPRLVLLGYGNFRAEHRAMHALLDELAVPHDYRDGPERQHDWHSGWVPEGVERLISRGEQ